MIKLTISEDIIYVVILDLYLDALNDMHYFYSLDADILFTVGGALTRII